MRILFVVQRYGTSVAGGAEQHCRWLAEGLAAMGHGVTVATTCALDYVTWANHFQQGSSILNGVNVVRFPVSHERNKEVFDAISHEIDFYGGRHDQATEKKWLLEQGPAVSGMDEWMITHRHSFDVAIVFTYLYQTAGIAITALKGYVPVFMHATAHDEPPIRLQTLRFRLSLVDHFLCSTPEEVDILQRIAGVTAPAHTVGIGVRLPRAQSLVATLTHYKIPRKRFALILGRVDESKGVLTAMEFFRASGLNKHLRLVVAGENIARLQSDDDISITGYVSESARAALLYAAEFLIQPSAYESFSLALHEAWLAGRPSLANQECLPVAGQTERAQAGLLYNNLGTFATAGTLLATDYKLRSRLGQNGKAFVETNFTSDVVLKRIESLLLAVTH